MVTKTIIPLTKLIKVSSEWDFIFIDYPIASSLIELIILKMVPFKT